MAVQARAAAFDALARVFDGIFVITLERARERQAAVRERLAGLPFEFFLGVDKQDLTMEGIQSDGRYDPARARRLHRHGKAMALGQVACALSHRAL